MPSAIEEKQAGNLRWSKNIKTQSCKSFAKARTPQEITFSEFFASRKYIEYSYFFSTLFAFKMSFVLWKTTHFNMLCFNSREYWARFTTFENYSRPFLPFLHMQFLKWKVLLGELFLRNFLLFQEDFLLKTVIFMFCAGVGTFQGHFFKYEFSF